MNEVNKGVGHLATITNCNKVRIYKNGIIELSMNEPDGPIRIDIIHYLGLKDIPHNTLSNSQMFKTTNFKGGINDVKRN